jgi:hypothetical protein
MRTFLLVTLLGLGACGGSALEGEMKDWKNKMCACTDKACAEKTMDEYRTWMKGKREAAKDMSDGEKQKLGAIEEDLKACRKKLRDDGADKAGGDKAGGDKAGGGEKPPEKPADKPADK